MICAAIALCLAGGAPATSRDLVVFAAASLKTALDEVNKAFTAAEGQGVVVSYAGSSVLARQIGFGAPADVFISASPEWMDTLSADGRIDQQTRFDLLGNRLVLIAHGQDQAPVDISAASDLKAMLGGGRLAMALVDAVPAGIYGKAALDHFGLWDQVEGAVAQTDNVRAALALVATGEAPLGIVYATDATTSDTVSVVATFPDNAHPPIVYPAAAVTGDNRDAAQIYLDFLRGPVARASFERQGFAVLME
jgi:molybdate transport system substrate-binding protein